MMVYCLLSDLQSLKSEVRSPLTTNRSTLNPFSRFSLSLSLISFRFRYPYPFNPNNPWLKNTDLTDLTDFFVFIFVFVRYLSPHNKARSATSNPNYMPACKKSYLNPQIKAIGFANYPTFTTVIRMYPRILPSLSSFQDL